MAVANIEVLLKDCLLLKDCYRIGDVISSDCSGFDISTELGDHVAKNFYFGCKDAVVVRV